MFDTENSPKRVVWSDKKGHSHGVMSMSVSVFTFRV